MPSLVLGPQALDTTRRYTIGPLKGPDGVALTATVTLTGSEPLACRLWRGEGSDALATPAAVWRDTAAGVITLTIAPADLAALAPGRYRVELTATIGGEALACLPADACIDLADTPGSLAVASWLCSAEDLRAALGTAFGRRPDLPDLIDDASQVARDYCRRDFAQADLDEVYDGAGRPRIMLRRPPLVSVTAVSVNGIDLDNTSGSEWSIVPEVGELVRGDGRGDPRFAPAWIFGFPRWPDGSPTGSSGTPVWAPGTRNVRVRYTGGYASVPGPVRRATIILAKHLADSTRNTGLYSLERIGDYEYQIAPNQADDLPFVVRALLNPYVLPQWS